MGRQVRLTHTLNSGWDIYLCPFEILYMMFIHVMSLKEESGRFFFHFREICEKCIECIEKFLIHFREILIFC